MKYLITFLISLAVFVGGVNVPADWFNFSKTLLGGTSLTDISGSNTLSAFPTTYNANNLIIETVLDTITGTTTNSTITTLSGLTTAGSLATVGTITSGNWNATAIPVNKGGTGTTSPSVWMVMLGNGSSGLTMASTTGTLGQVFTSNGATSYPSWQTYAVDESANYNWTGTNLFTTLHASSTLTIGGVALTFPTSQGASSTVFKQDASGNIITSALDWDLLGEANLGGLIAATTTVPARREFLIVIDDRGKSSTGADTVIQFNGSAPATAQYGGRYVLGGTRAAASMTKGIGLLNVATTTGFYIHAHVLNNTSIRKYVYYYGVDESGVGAAAPMDITGAGVWNNTSDAITSITILTDSAGITFSTGSRFWVYGSKN